MISREEALKLIDEYLKNPNLKKHVLAVEAIMAALAEKLGEDVEKWRLIGLLHDLDYEITSDDFSKHGIKTVEILGDKIDENMREAIMAHNFENTGVEPKSLVAKALIAADAVSGLIIATALVMPSKKLHEVKLKTLKKKFKDKSFARGSKRERILMCEEIGIPLVDFLEISLKALQEIADKLGL